MAGVGAQTAVAAAMFGTLVAMGGVFASLDAPVGLTLAVVGAGALAGGQIARIHPGPADSFARDVAGVVGLGAVVTGLEGVAWWWTFAIGEDRSLDRLASATLASFLLGAALVPASAALRDLEARAPRTAPRPKVAVLSGMAVLFATAAWALLGVEQGTLVLFFLAMAVTPMVLGTRIQGLAPAVAALLVQGVVALLVSLVAGKVGAVVLAESAWRIAVVLPVLAPMVVGTPTRSPPPPRRLGWAETGAMTCGGAAIAAALGGSLAGVKQDEPLLALPVVAVLAFVPSVGAWLSTHAAGREPAG